MTMAKKKKARRRGRKQAVQKKESNFWMITAIVAVVLLVGVTAKTLFTSSQSPAPITTIQQPTGQPIAIQPATPLVSNSVDNQVRQVAVNFKCACGCCGELPLAECQCDMPHGAIEEKRFIRTKLIEGISVPQVIELVDKKYGQRAT
jgi:hypothetical protein